MRQGSSVLLAICLVLPLVVWASPTPFESAGADVREYIVLSLASHIRANSTIGLFLSRGDDDVKDGVIPWYYTFELGQERSRCLEILKGDVSIADYTFCFFYCTPRENLEVFPVRSGCVGGWEYVRSYRWKGKTYPCRGKEVWQFEPPYDPFRSDWNDEYVRLMFLTPERKLDISRIKLLKPSKVYEGETIASKVKGDVRKMPPEEVMRQLGVEGVFSNRVFRLNEGGVFQVDYDVPQLKGRVLDETARRCLDAEGECQSRAPLGGGGVGGRVPRLRGGRGPGRRGLRGGGAAVPGHPAPVRAALSDGARPPCRRGTPRRHAPPRGEAAKGGPVRDRLVCSFLLLLPCVAGAFPAAATGGRIEPYADVRGIRRKTGTAEFTVDGVRFLRVRPDISRPEVLTLREVRVEKVR